MEVHRRIESGGSTHGLAERDREVAVVPEQERPGALLELEPNEDARTLEKDVGSDERLLETVTNSNKVRSDVLNLERCRPAQRVEFSEVPKEVLRRAHHSLLPGKESTS